MIEVDAALLEAKARHAPQKTEFTACLMNNISLL
jgi:hypothetical protein